MPTVLENKVTQLRTLIEQRDSIDREIAEILGLEDSPIEEDEEEPTPKKKKHKRAITCSSCGKTGHQKRTCNAEPVSELSEENSDKSDDDLAKDIKRLFVDEDMYSTDVCSELGIPFSQFNRIVIKYKIVKK